MRIAGDPKVQWRSRERGGAPQATTRTTPAPYAHAQHGKSQVLLSGAPVRSAPRYLHMLKRLLEPLRELLSLLRSMSCTVVVWRRPKFRCPPVNFTSTSFLLP